MWAKIGALGVLVGLVSGLVAMYTFISDCSGFRDCFGRDPRDLFAELPWTPGGGPPAPSPAVRVARLVPERNRHPEHPFAFQRPDGWRRVGAAAGRGVRYELPDDNRVSMAVWGDVYRADIERLVEEKKSQIKRLRKWEMDEEWDDASREKSVSYAGKYERIREPLRGWRVVYSYQNGTTRVTVAQRLIKVDDKVVWIYGTAPTEGYQ